MVGVEKVVKGCLFGKISALQQQARVTSCLYDDMRTNRTAAAGGVIARGESTRRRVRQNGSLKESFRVALIGAKAS
jgi:hypothetical protein